MYVVVILYTAKILQKKFLVIALNFFGTKKREGETKKNPEKHHIIHSSVKSFLNLRKKKVIFHPRLREFYQKKVTLRNFRDNEKKKEKKGCSIKNSGEK